MANDGRNLFISFLYFIYRSTDNGQNWSLVGPAALRGNITVLKFSGANLYAVTGNPEHLRLARAFDHKAVVAAHVHARI